MEWGLQNERHDPIRDIRLIIVVRCRHLLHFSNHSNTASSVAPSPSHFAYWHINETETNRLKL